MSNIVEFKSRPPAEPLVWQCNCGSGAFWLYSDHSAVCVECDTEVEGMDGYWRTPSAPPAQNGDEPTSNGVREPKGSETKKRGADDGARPRSPAQKGDAVPPLEKSDD